VSAKAAQGITEGDIPPGRVRKIEGVKIKSMMIFNSSSDGVCCIHRRLQCVEVGALFLSSSWCKAEELCLKSISEPSH
jgi:hypothetical protein